ncbi:MAG TPA: citrate/2-methylcitrate synthase [Chloroflexota bacterium]|nr:citrate/2-methylcitrate synthase [Chloroflexota bacterium]
MGRRDEKDSGGLVPLRSGIAYIDEQAGELLYRGHNIHDIAERLSFEETVFLLWQGRLATMDEGRAFADELATYREVPEAIVDLLRITPEYAHPMAALRTAVSMLACVDPDQDEPGREAHELKAKKLVAQLPTIVAAQHRIGQGLETLPTDPDLSHAANYLYLLTGRLPDELECRALGVLMNLFAEHELASSTYTARLVIDTKSDFYSAMVAALGALKGPLHAGGLDDVMRMFLDIGWPDKADDYVEHKLALHSRLPGYGHRLYEDRDPRTQHVKVLLAELAKRHDRWYLLAEAVARSVERRTGAHPNLDFYAAPVLYHVGFPLELFTNVIASARVAGWAAHVLEQYGGARLSRARADYVGPHVGI